MANLSYAQLEAIWNQAAQGTKYAGQSSMPGVSWAALMAAIAVAESGGNPAITNPNDNGGKQTSWGLWQISNGDHTPPSPNWNNPLVNAQLAIAKLNSQGLGAWGTYTSGAYKADLSASTSPDTSILNDPNLLAASSAAAAADAAASSTGQADCAWQLSIPGISSIPVIGSSVGTFCVISRSQLRGLLGVALMAAAFAPAALAFGILAQGIPGVGTAERTGAGALLGSLIGPEGTVAGAAAGAESGHKRAQERHDESVARQVEGRRRDSPAGPALRDDDGRSRARRLATAGQGRSTAGVPF